LACCGSFPVEVLSSQNDTIRRFPYLDQERQAAMFGVLSGFCLWKTLMTIQPLRKCAVASKRDDAGGKTGRPRDADRARSKPGGEKENGKKEATASEKS